MKNYIPADFYENNKTTVYSTKENCIEIEGSAIGFNPNEINLSTHTLVNGEFIVDESKVDLKCKEVEVQALYDEMVSDIYNEMEKTFGTKNDVSASAFASTFEAMAKRPANYIEGFENEAAVVAFADLKLASADAYGLYRFNRIEKFKADKSALLGE